MTIILIGFANLKYSIVLNSYKAMCAHDVCNTEAKQEEIVKKCKVLADASS